MYVWWCVTLPNLLHHIQLCDNFTLIFLWPNMRVYIQCVYACITFGTHCITSEQWLDLQKLTIKADEQGTLPVILAAPAFLADKAPIRSHKCKSAVWKVCVKTATYLCRHLIEQLMKYICVPGKREDKLLQLLTSPSCRCDESLTSAL